MANRSPQGLAQSPWFWLHLFAVFCLIVLMVRGDKIVALRTQRATNARMRESVAGQGGALTDRRTLSEVERGRLAGAFLFFGAVAIGSWWQVWRLVLRPHLKSDVEILVHRPSARQTSHQ